MTDTDNRITQLSNKLDILLQKQRTLSQAFFELQTELNQLKATQKETTETIIEEPAKETPPQEIRVTPPPAPVPPVKEWIPERKQTQNQSNWEKFIGENLLSKIGIVILVIGVAIGAKYAIEHQLISPLMRIILGYLVGGGLLGFAFKLKAKYTNFSAVLLSGASAIVYFITYFAYDFYQLIPQIPAFGLMVVFTAFTVGAAIHYNRQMIAHLGLVGAYAIPFLLSDGSGKFAVLLSYMAIINTGILVVSIKKYWKPLYYVSFGLTWLIYFFWYVSDLTVSDATGTTINPHFGLALTFLILFFIIFYLAFLGYKFIKNETFTVENIVLLLANSFIFYGFGYEILEHHSTGIHLLGLFTFCNALLHCLISVLIYKRKLVDKNLFYLTFGLMLVFVTITIPVQFNGNWITLLWSAEAVLLFWIGRKKQVPVYEFLSYPLILLSFISLIYDWIDVYLGFPLVEFLPVFNIHCFTSVLSIIAFGWITLLNQKEVTDIRKDSSNLINYAIPVLLIFTVYTSFRLEIAHYYNLQLWRTHYTGHSIATFKTIWILNYSLFFVSALSFVNLKKIKNQALGYASIILTVITIFVFLIQGLLLFSELREDYLNSSVNSTVLNIGIRYISFVFMALALYSTFLYTKTSFITKTFKTVFDIVLHLSILWIVSSEFLHWIEMFHYTEGYKIVSILWGMYALLLIILGIWKKKKHLRIGAMILFGVTLMKLFVYDMTHFGTIAKTIVFVSLGIILLIISFLYNKYKRFISEEHAEE